MESQPSSLNPPALESQDEALEPGVFDEVERAKDLAALRDVTCEIDAQGAKVFALESVIEFLSENRKLTPLETRLLTITANQYNVPLGTTRTGFALEAFQGPEARLMTSITLESFKEHLDHAIEYVISLFKKLGEFIERVFKMYRIKIETIRGILQKSVSKPADQRPVATSSTYHYLHHYFTLDDRLDVERILDNLKGVIENLADHEFYDGMRNYSEKLVEFAEKFAAEQGESENWRTHTADFNRLSPPEPRSFHVTEQNTGTKQLTSPFLPGRFKLTYTTLSDGNNHGKRGAMERAESLSKLGNVTIFRQYPGNPTSDTIADRMSSISNAKVSAWLPTMFKVLDDSMAMYHSSQRMSADIAHLSTRLQELRSKVTEIDGDRGKVISDIIVGVPKASSLLSQLADRTMQAVLKSGMVFTHLVASNFDARAAA